MKQWMLNCETSEPMLTSRSDKCSTQSFKENLYSLVSENHKSPLQKLMLNKSQVRPEHRIQKNLNKNENEIRLSMIVRGRQSSGIGKVIKPNGSEHQYSQFQQIQNEWKQNPLYANYYYLQRKLEKNEKDIQALRLKIEKQESGPSKLLLGLKDIQDVYKIIGDIKNINNESSRKTSQSILLMKANIEEMKDKIMRVNRNWQINWHKIQSFIKENQKKAESLVNKKNYYDKEEEISIGDLVLQINRLKNEIENIRNKDLERSSKEDSIYSLFPNFVKHGDTSSQPIRAQIQIKEKIKVRNEEVEARQFIYYIDEKGFLLDENKLYLVDCLSRLVKISEPELKKLGEICRIVQT